MTGPGSEGRCRFTRELFRGVLMAVLLGLVLSRRHQRPDFCSGLPGDEDGSFLWMVKQDPPSYFFGTIHVPYTRVWEHVPNNTKKAFEMSDSVMFELDLTDPATISALTLCQLLPKGQSLADVLPGDLYHRLKRHLSYVRSQMPRWLTPPDNTSRWAYANYLFDAITGNWERKRPVWVMLMVNSLTESDIRSRGVPVLDLYLAQEAEKMTKVTGAVEEVQEQCMPLNGLNFSQSAQFCRPLVTRKAAWWKISLLPLLSTSTVNKRLMFCGSVLV
ncbi:Pheromone shutdown TraB [Trinorchestia longiramus]|nr:Pheromone shutdown TraB [Trinorchestia longiramus]